MTETQERPADPNTEPTVELQKPPQPPQPPFWTQPAGRAILIAGLSLLLGGAVLLTVFDVKFSGTIDKRLANGPFAESFNVYTAPRSVMVGDSVTPTEVVAALRRSGYTVSRGNPMGWFNVRSNAVEIFPGRDSFTGGEAGMIEFAGGKVTRIVSLQDHTQRREFELEPQLLGNLSGKREKRRLVRYPDIPKSLVHAVVATEDKHFFQHAGFDVSRIVKAAWIDLRQGRKEQGASTLTMQLARGFWLDPDKNWKRKFEEFVITMHLEGRLTKQQIFEDYANQVYLGRHGTFNIHGFGEASRAYFGKELTQVTLPEAALLAGMVQRPSYFNPYRYPDRARERRDLVLNMMHQNEYLTDAEYHEAIAAPINLSRAEPESMENQYFVDLMNEQLPGILGDEKQAGYIYTTLDPDLQHAAEEAVRIGMPLVDQELHKAKVKTAQHPQVALIALDPHTGEIKALVGGRNYEGSQLNHALAMRQPGSAFKPFVYAAALDTAVEGGSQIFTPSSVVNDEPATFRYGRTVYTPGNFHQHFMGQVTLRTALAHSLNVAAVEVAEEVGYDRVVAMARRAGLNNNIKATPAVALGAYETTPLEIAGAYTMFANHGQVLAPTTVSLVRGADSTELYRHRAEVKSALDPRVAYLMVNMMQEVLRSGTGAAVRSRGFTLPAAGKTGTSHDGWFAGFTSELLCIVWVGFDDNHELNLEGAKSALPIWTEFMKRASQFRPYRDAQAFQPPPGVTTVHICAESGQLATEYCPDTRNDVFISGTEPVVQCQLHSINTQQFADRMVEEERNNPNSMSPSAATQPRTIPMAATPATNTRTVPPAAPASQIRVIVPQQPAPQPQLPPATAPRTIPMAQSPATAPRTLPLAPPVPPPPPKKDQEKQ